MEGVRGGAFLLRDREAVDYLGTQRPVVLELGVNAEARRFSARLVELVKAQDYLELREQPSADGSSTISIFVRIKDTGETTHV